MRKVCKWGDRCKFRHIYNNVQGHSHESNGRRHDRNHDHYGNNHLTGDQNGYRYGDGPDDPWDYVRPNGRHQNKREPHNPNSRRNYNINNKHIYSDTHRGYNSHLNSHQGSQMNHSNGKKQSKRKRASRSLEGSSKWKVQSGCKFFGVSAESNGLAGAHGGEFVETTEGVHPSGVRKLGPCETIEKTM